MTQVLERLAYVLRAETEGLAGDLKGAESHLNKFTQFVERNPLAAAGALGAALVGVGIKATSMALEVERGLRRIERVVPGAVGQLGKLRDEIEATSRVSPRSQAELAKAADAIARAGVESVGGLAQRLQATTRAADASGEELIGIIGGLDQALDLFGKSSGASEEMLAKLFATAKGRFPLEDLFGALQAATPTILRFNLDFETSIRALGALIEKGRSAKQAGAALKEYGEQGAAGAAEIRKLAESHTIAANALADYNAAVVKARSSNDALWQVTKNGLNAELIKLGQEILPTVNTGLRAMVGLVSALSGTTAKVYAQAGIATLLTPGTSASDRRKAFGSMERAADKGTLDLSGLSLEDLATLRNAMSELFDSMDRRSEAWWSKTRLAITTAAAAARRATAAPTGSPAASGTPGRVRTPEQIAADEKAAADAQKAETAAWAEHQRELERVAADRRHDVEADQVLIEEWTKGYQRLKASAQALKQAQAELGEVMERKGVANLKEDVQEFKKKQANALANMVDSISQAVSGAVALANAFGMLDANAAAALQSISQIGDGVATIMKAGKGDIASILQIAGNLISLGKSLFGQSESDKQNTASVRAINRLADRLGDLVNANISGGEFGKIRSATTDYVAAARLDAFRRRAEGGPTGMLSASKFYEALGIPFEDVKRLAATLGVTLNGTAESFRNLDRALAEADFASYIDSFVGQMDLLNDRFEIYGVTDPTAKFRAVLDALMDPDKGAPAIFAALGAIDLSTSEGQAQAKALLQGIFEKGAIGGFGTDLGGLNPQQLIDVVKQLLGYIGAPGAAGGATGANLGVISGFRGLTEAAGDRMSDYLQGIYTVARELLALERARDAGRPLVPPALSFGSPTAGVGGTSVVVHFTQNNYGVTDAAGVGRAASDGVRAGIEEALTFTRVKRAMVASGNLKAIPT